MKVIFLLISSLSLGGAEKVIAQLSKDFSSNFQVHILVYRNDSIKYEHKGIVHILDKKFNKSCFFNFFNRLNELNKLLKTYKPSSVISFLDSPNLLNLFSNNHQKKILSIRNSNFNFFTFFYVFISTFLNIKIVTVSEFINKSLKRIFFWNKHIFVKINNFVSHDDLLEKAKEKIEDIYAPIFLKNVIVSVGRLVHQKNFMFLLKIALELKILKIPVNFLILGEGKQRNLLLSYVKKHGLSDSVFFIGFQKNPYKFIYNSKIFILPSRHEGFSNAMLEAMSLYNYVIAYNTKSGNDELLSLGDSSYVGLIKNNFNSKDWAHSIVNLYNNNSLLDELQKASFKKSLAYSKNLILKLWFKLL